MTKNFNSLVKTILSQPTAPFRETWVTQKIEDFCKEKKIPFWKDDFNNIWVGPKNKKKAAKTSLLFVAHLDHPGIVLTDLKAKSPKGKHFVTGKWLGGGPSNLEGHAVKVFSTVDRGMILDGKIVGTTLALRSVDEVTIEIQGMHPHLHKEKGPFGACLWYKDAPQGVALKEGQWVTKAADDLMGVCTLLWAFSKLKKKNDVSLLFTRGEESGFHGTLAVLEEKILDPTRTAMVSIECSAFRDQAEPGKGPVVRLGDRTSTFHPALTQWLINSAQELRKKTPGCPFQKRIMDGGSCEATAFNAYGYMVAGISIPLINYHNIAPNQTEPRPEAVHENDVSHLISLLEVLMQNNPVRKKGMRTLQKDVFQNFRSILTRHHKDECALYK